MNRNALLVSIGAFILGLNTHSVVINFDDATRGPAPSVAVRGVTITGSGDVATVAGVGAGASDSGGIATVDRGVIFVAGSFSGSNPSLISSPEYINLSVNGVINSVTIETHFSVLAGPATTAVAEFQLHCSEWFVSDFGSGDGYFWISPNKVSTLTFPDMYGTGGPSVISLGSVTDWGIMTMWETFLDLQEQLGYPEAAYEYGFTVKSVDFTPPSIDELVPCTGPITGGTWKKHGDYLAAVNKAVQNYFNLGYITAEEANTILSNAAHSECGSKVRPVKGSTKN